MQTLLDLIHRAPVALPWAEGDNIPWNEPEFSKRMLREHLNPDHDAASRSPGRIDRHVKWIHEEMLGGEPSRILDLGCGPGFYTSRLAALGHDPWGIDFSPASIDHANQTTNLTHLLGDVRETDFGSRNDLIMMLFGEINVFKPSDVRSIFERARKALAPGGKLLLEAHTEHHIRRLGCPPASWRTYEQGLFSDRPHLLLQEHFLDTDQNVATIRYFVVDAATAIVTRYAQSLAWYSEEALRSMLTAAGFEAVSFGASLGEDDLQQDDFFTVVASIR